MTEPAPAEGSKRPLKRRRTPGQTNLAGLLGKSQPGLDCASACRWLRRLRPKQGNPPWPSTLSLYARRARLSMRTGQSVQGASAAIDDAAGTSAPCD